MSTPDRKSPEPFDPHHTPTPPQRIDPQERSESIREDAPAAQQQEEQVDIPGGDKKPGKNKETKEKLLGESPTEITDETTI